MENVNLSDSIHSWFGCQLVNLQQLHNLAQPCTMLCKPWKYFCGNTDAFWSWCTGLGVSVNGQVSLNCYAKHLAHKMEVVAFLSWAEVQRHRTAADIDLSVIFTSNNIHFPTHYLSTGHVSVRTYIGADHASTYMDPEPYRCSIMPNCPLLMCTHWLQASCMKIPYLTKCVIV